MLQSQPDPHLRNEMRTIVNELIADVAAWDTTDNHLAITQNPEDFLISKAYDRFNIPIITGYLSRNFFHAKVHQQFVFNLCGYHVLHAMFNMVSYLESGFEKYIHNVNSCKNFWHFRHRIIHFLFEFSLKRDLVSTTSSWSQDWCFTGDLERIHLMAIMQFNPEFIGTFRSDILCDISYFTLEYQFGTFVTPIDKLIELQKIIDQFNSPNPKKRTRIVSLFIGACNHWIGFLAYERNGRREFILIDSRNKDYLDWNTDKIFREIEAINQQKIKDRLQPWCEFRKRVNTQCVFDIQDIVKFLLEVFEAKTTILDHLFNSVFAKHYHTKYAIIFDKYRDIFSSNLNMISFWNYARNEFPHIEQFVLTLHKIVTHLDHLSAQSKKHVLQIIDKEETHLQMCVTGLRVKIWGSQIRNQCMFILEQKKYL